MDLPERQPDRFCLSVQKFGANRVHGDAIEGLVHRGEQADDLDILSLAKRVQRPGAVLATAPRKQRLG